MGVKQLVCVDCGTVENECAIFGEHLVEPRGPCIECGSVRFTEEVVYTDG